MPLHQLEERIEQEMEENPILELREDEPDDEEPRETAEEEDSIPDDRELVIDEDSDNKEDFERLLEMDQQWPDTFEEHSSSFSHDRIEQENQRRHDTMANMPSPSQTLQDYLHDQLAWFDLDDEIRAMCERIIYNLDDSGFLQSSLEDLLGPKATETDHQVARKALSLVQRLDPPGVGARNIQECLLMQLTPDIPHYEVLQTLIADHLEDLEHNRLPVISKKTGFSISLIQEAMKELRRLNLRPGSMFQDETAPTVSPDLFVEKNQQDKYEVRLQDGRSLDLYISPYYRKLFKEKKATKETREYIKQKLGSAQWLIDSIQQRRTTLKNVAQAIVDHQTDFLEHGPHAIRPLKMQQIADQVGVHVTTVSRAVDDKWIQTPRGIFPLKRFFSGSLGGHDGNGEEATPDAVRIKLQEIIDGEDKKKPLSDEDLVAALEEEGFKVARRTVTKYRKAMDIPSSRQRRVWQDK